MALPPSPPHHPVPARPSPPGGRKGLWAALAAAIVLGAAAGFGAVAYVKGSADGGRSDSGGRAAAGSTPPSRETTTAAPGPSEPTGEISVPPPSTATVTRYVSPPPEDRGGSRAEPDRIDPHPGGPASAVPGSACTARPDGRYDCRVGKAGGVSVIVPGSPDLPRGTIPQGKNWFVCQWTGPQKSYRRWTNHWWALTNSDQGGWGWVPAIYITGGGNNEPVPGLPMCGAEEVARHR